MKLFTSDRLDSLVDFIKRLQRCDEVDLSPGAIRTVAIAVRKIPENFLIPLERLADCLLLVQDGKEFFKQGCDRAMQICDQRRDVPLLDNISTLYHLADRNKPVSRDEWDTSICLARQNGRTGPSYPDQVLADKAGTALFRIITGQQLPDDFSPADTLKCILASALVIHAPDLRLRAVEMMVSTVKDNQLSGAIPPWLQQSTRRVSASLTTRDTRLGSSARDLLDRVILKEAPQPPTDPATGSIVVSLTDFRQRVRRSASESSSLPAPV